MACIFFLPFLFSHFVSLVRHLFVCVYFLRQPLKYLLRFLTNNSCVIAATIIISIATAGFWKMTKTEIDTHRTGSWRLDKMTRQQCRWTLLFVCWLSWWVDCHIVWWWQQKRKERKIFIEAVKIHAIRQFVGKLKQVVVVRKISDLNHL